MIPSGSARFHGRVVARHRRVAGRPAPLRLSFARRGTTTVIRASDRVVTVAPRHTVQRLSLVVAPRITLDVGPAPALAPPAPAPVVATTLLHRVERTVHQLVRHAVRVERSELVVRDVVRQPVREVGTPSRPPVLEAPPRMSPARPPAAAAPIAPAVAQPAGVPSAPTAAPAARPIDTVSITDHVMREIDRRVVAERERLGRLA